MIVDTTNRFKTWLNPGTALKWVSGRPSSWMILNDKSTLRQACFQQPCNSPRSPNQSFKWESPSSSLERPCLSPCLFLSQDHKPQWSTQLLSYFQSLERAHGIFLMDNSFLKFFFKGHALYRNFYISVRYTHFNFTVWFLRILKVSQAKIIF